MNFRAVATVLGLGVFVVALDQLTKDIALSVLDPGKSVPFIGELLKFYLIRNDSAAFSIGNGQTWIFTLISAIATLALLWFGPRAKTVSWRVTAGFLLGGVVGNLIDRVFREPGFPNGHVIDFLQLPFGFPIFNLADTVIVLTMSVVMVRIIRGDKVGE